MRTLIASAVYDLGIHAHQVLREVSGLELIDLSADVRTVVEGGQVYDDCQVALHLSRGARGSAVREMVQVHRGLRVVQV